MMAERTGANRNYHTAAIRKLLFEACTDEELTILCYDYFRPVHDQFTAGMSRRWKIYLLLDYCEKQGQLDELLNRIQEINPNQYTQFVPLIKVSDQAVKVEMSLKGREAPLSMPAGPLDIIKVGHIPLTLEEEAVLQTLYSRYGQIGIETEFGSGLSGSRVFRVRLEEYLPEAVKIAPMAVIEKERQAYQIWVENKLYNIARIQAAPDSPPVGGLSGLRYDLVGGGSVDVQSLSEYYRETSADNLSRVLKRLFAEMSDKWWLNTRQVRRLFQMKTDYDALLPVNALIKPLDPPLDSLASTLTPDNLPALKAEEFLKLEGWVITEVDHSRGQVTLNLPPSSPGTPQKSHRLRLVDVPNIGDYQEGAHVGPIYGQVKATRRDLLVNQVHQALGEDFDLSAEKLKSGSLILPNPLPVVEDYLNQLRTVRISTIHGDLNLENILVDRDTGAVKLIDFATVREGHVLHDLLRLETEVVTKLIPTALSEANVPPKKSASWCHDLYQQLPQASFPLDQLPHPGLKKPVAMLVAIREMARKCLFNPDDWTEYYQGLTLYLLGALKFKNLDEMPQAPVPKQIAFWAAATVVDLLNSADKGDEDQAVYDDLTSPKQFRQSADPTTSGLYRESQDVKRNSMTNDEKSYGGVNIGKIKGDIIGSAIAGGDVTITTTISGQPTPAGQKPTVAELKQLLTEIQQELAEITVQQNVLRKVSVAAPFTAQGAEQSVKEAAEKVKSEMTREEAKSVRKSLDDAANLLERILEDAKTVGQKAVEVGRAVMPITEMLEPLVEKIGTAALWVTKLWLKGG